MSGRYRGVRPVIPTAIAIGAIGLIPATGHGPSAVRTGTAAAKAAVRRIATGVGYYDTSTRIVVDTHGCANAPDLTAFGVVWIGRSTPNSWLGWSSPRSGTMHRTSFSHATFRADGGGTVEFKHPDGRVFDSLECVLQ